MRLRWGTDVLAGHCSELPASFSSARSRRNSCATRTAGRRWMFTPAQYRSRRGKRTTGWSSCCSRKAHKELQHLRALLARSLALLSYSLVRGLFGGPDRDRTDDLFHAMEARSQLRHRPTIRWGTTFLFSPLRQDSSNRAAAAAPRCHVTRKVTSRNLEVPVGILNGGERSSA